MSCYSFIPSHYCSNCLSTITGTVLATSLVSSLARACERTNCVCTHGVCVTIMCSSRAFVDIYNKDVIHFECAARYYIKTKCNWLLQGWAQCCSDNKHNNTRHPRSQCKYS